MMLPHLIDAVRGGKFQNVCGYAPKATDLFLKSSHIVECFDFGELILEPADEDENNFKTPKLTDEEEGFWTEGLIPLPAPVLWFEFKLAGTTSGLLILKVDGGMKVSRCEYQKNQREYSIDGVWTWFERHGMKGNYVHLKVMDERIGAIVDKKPAYFKETHYASSFQLAKYFLLMLNSRTTEIARVVPDAALNKARTKRGAAPLKSHTVVTIVPTRFLRGERPEGERGTHASPRLHWRRSHVRVLASGKRILIARMLVGRRELGEISHEYRFKP